MTLDKLVLNSILGDSNEEALETVRQMRLARVQGATLSAQKTTRSVAKPKTMQSAKKRDINSMSREEKLAMLALLEGA